MSNSSKVNEKGLLIILSSPSGAGKSTLAQRIKSWDRNCVFSISATTRKPREGEQDGKDYYFISEEEFRNKASKGEMLEHAEVFGNWYGSPMSPVLSSIDSGNDVLFDVDWQGSQQIKNSSLGKYVLSIFILPPSIKELESRLKLRNQDSIEVISKSLRVIILTCYRKCCVNTCTTNITCHFCSSLVYIFILLNIKAVIPERNILL